MSKCGWEGPGASSLSRPLLSLQALHCTSWHGCMSAVEQGKQRRDAMRPILHALMLCMLKALTCLTPSSFLLSIKRCACSASIAPIIGHMLVPEVTTKTQIILFWLRRALVTCERHEQPVCHMLDTSKRQATFVTEAVSLHACAGKGRACGSRGVLPSPPGFWGCAKGACQSAAS